MVKFIIIRHGYSIYNKERRYTGQANIPLTDIGVRQAELTAAYIRENYKVDAIFASDLDRAVNTAKPLADALGLPIHTSARLRELDVGLWQDMLFVDVKERFAASHAAFRAAPAHNRCDGGESYAELQARVLAEIADIAAAHDGETVVIASHGGAIRALLSDWMQIPLESVYQVPEIPNASVTIAEYEAGRAKVLLRGYNEHLAGLNTK